MSKNLVPLSVINRLAKERTPEVDRVEYANNKRNKYVAFVGKKKIKFGALAYQDFLIHKDEERRKRYWIRH